MAENVIIRQNHRFETEVLAQDPHTPGDPKFRPISDVRGLTPYGMLLTSLGSCTAIVVNTYAQNHGVPLQEVEIQLAYDRLFGEDCEHCEGINEYHEQITEEIRFSGPLTPEQHKRLFAVSKHCPIHKMLLSGIEVQSSLGGEE